MCLLRILQQDFTIYIFLSYNLTMAIYYKKGKNIWLKFRFFRKFYTSDKSYLNAGSISSDTKRLFIRAYSKFQVRNAETPKEKQFVNVAQEEYL